MRLGWHSLGIVNRGNGPCTIVVYPQHVSVTHVDGNLAVHLRSAIGLATVAKPGSM